MAKSKNTKNKSTTKTSSNNKSLDLYPEGNAFGCTSCVYMRTEPVATYCWDGVHKVTTCVIKGCGCRYKRNKVYRQINALEERILERLWRQHEEINHG
jgi:hypothetical protein